MNATTAKLNKFLEYLKETNKLQEVDYITDKGFPNMKYKKNRELYEEFNSKYIESFECPVCLCDISDSECRLKCSHKLCVDCFANVARMRNDCPMCRSEISTTVVKKIVAPTEHVVDALVLEELDATYSDRDNSDLYDYVNALITNNQEANGGDTESTTSAIVLEVFESMKNITRNVIDIMLENN